MQSNTDTSPVDSNGNIINPTYWEEISGNVAADLNVRGTGKFQHDVQIEKNLNVRGDLVVEGSTLITDEQTVSTSSNYVILRKNNPSALGSTEKAGMVIHNYDSNKSAFIGVDSDGIFRISDSVSEDTHVYTNISKFGSTYYTGLTQTPATVATGAVVAEDLDELTDCVINNSLYYHNLNSQWFAVSLVSNTLYFDNTNPVTDTSLIAVLEESTKRTLFYFRTISILEISDATNQPVFTRAETTDLTDEHLLMWNTANTKAVDSGFSKTEIQNLITTVTLLGGLRDLTYKKARWLRFSSENKKALIILAGTLITVGSATFYASTDTVFDLSEYLTLAGTDYFIYLTYDDSTGSFNLSASTSKSADTSTTRYIGRLHTLCVSIPANTTMIMSCNNVSAGDTILVKPYTDSDPDFQSFYSKTVSSVQAGARASGVVQGPFYDVATLPHPLAGFNAGDILPESVWCLTFRPNTRYEDAMIYDKATDKAIDIYLQSGTGANTRSAYNAAHTTNRLQICHVDDMFQVGKELLSDSEFTAAALGSNECTNIAGSADKTTVGGHTDTAGRRMISAIGCEECCGYLWQCLRDIAALGTGTAATNIDNLSGHNVGNSGWITEDGQNKFGQMLKCVTILHSGGHWGSGSSCGSHCRNAFNARSFVAANVSSRGSSRVIQNI